jgi:hypothetical protein
MAADKEQEYQDGSEVFYGLCNKTESGCCEKCTFGICVCVRFKSRKHSCFCCIFALMITSLFVAVILPLVLHEFLDHVVSFQSLAFILFMFHHLSIAYLQDGR